MAQREGQELHIIGNAHGTDPAKIVSLIDKIGLSEGDLYFDELKEGRWKNPAFIPPLRNYIEAVRDALSSKGSLIVPMGHDDLLYPQFSWPEVHACQPAEDVYMVEHVVVPVLDRNEHLKAVIHVGYTRMDRFVEELGKYGYKPEQHKLCERAPEIDFVLALRDFSEGRRNTYLGPEFIDEFFVILLAKMGRNYTAPEMASYLLSSGDPEFVADFRKVAPEVFADKALYDRHTKVPVPPLDQKLRQAYRAAKENCDRMLKYAKHPIIPANSL